jgi:chemotaxis protein MotB
MQNKNQIIVVRRRSQRSMPPTSSGAWKVAFADFALAMMALFLILWILAVSDDSEVRELARALRAETPLELEISPFLSSSASPVVDSVKSSHTLINSVSSSRRNTGHLPAGISMFNQVKDGRDQRNSGIGNQINSLLKGQYSTKGDLLQITRRIEQIAQKFHATGHVTAQLVPQGVRVLLQDSDERDMFRRGQARMSPFFEDMILELGQIFQQVENKVMISGHTDISRFHNGAYTNWELSGDRAHLARQVLEAGGMPKNRVVQIAAMGDRHLLNSNNPRSSKNRRIEILILTDKAEQNMAKMFAGSPLVDAAQRASYNEPVLRSVR